jgi:hypothetical protein
LVFNKSLIVMHQPLHFRQAHYLALFFILFCSANPLTGQSWDLMQKLGSADQEPGDNLGISVAMSGSYMIAGAWWEERPGTPAEGLTSAGAAYLYKLQTNGTWEQTQKLESPDREILGYYGFYVAMEGDYAMVGAFNEDHDETVNTGANAGLVYAYHRTANDVWVLDDSLKIESRGNNEYFGVAIAMTEDYALIGADGYDYDEAGANFMDNAGAAFLFKRQPNNQWEQVQQFVAPDRTPADQFGKHVDIDDEALVIGAFHKDQDFATFQTGAAYAFHCGDSGCDLEEATSADLQKLIAPDQNSYETFGWDVAISGTWLACGKSGESDQPAGGHGSNTGTTYFFHWENAQWVGKQKVFAPDFNAGAKFGRAVAMDGPVCVIGAGGESDDANGQHFVSGAGAAYVFELQPDDKWMPREKLIGTFRGIGDLLGEDAVDVSGSRVAAGAWLADTLNGNEIIDGGAVYVYERDSPITSINEYLSRENMTIINNPSMDGMLQVQQRDETIVVASMQIYSMTGEKVFHAENSDDHGYEVNLSHLPSGIYFVQIYQHGYLPETLKWVKL